MYRSLYFKIILIFAVFMITVMAVVGTVLLNSVFRFYTDDFVEQMDRSLAVGTQLRGELVGAMSGEGFAASQKQMLDAYNTSLGIDDYRNFYILDMNGQFLEGSNEEYGRALIKTPNLLSAMNRSDGMRQDLGSEYSDYAVCLSSDGRECIIYVKDTQEEMRQLSWRLFTLILQSVFFGLVIAVVLSFFLARAITSPIRSLTRGAQLVAAGEFTYEINVRAKDEIGVLTATFNNMKQVLKNTLDEVSGERVKLETIMSYLKDAVIAFSDEGRTIHINKSAVELLGVGGEEDGLTLDRMFAMLCIEYARSYVSALTSDKSVLLRNVVFESKALDISISTLRYIEDNRQHDGYIVVMHDITSRYELDKAQREFVANVSHELRTPLTVIKSSTESIIMYPDMDGSMKETFLNNVMEECDRMLRIVNDLLTLSRLENKKTKWQISTFDLTERLAHLCSLMKLNAQTKNQTISFRSDGPLRMTADRERIEQVVINIVSNAIKYTPENGAINVEAARSDSDVVVRIIDNGIGIPEGDLPRLFDRFYRVEKARTSDSGGTGLGLAIAKEIVEAHGGNISVKSRLGEGTEVIIRLPSVSRLAGQTGEAK